MTDLLEALAGLDPRQNANPFWQERITAADLGYRCGPLRARSNRDEPRMAAAIDAAGRLKALSKSAGQIIKELGRDELVGYVFWMRAAGCLDDVLDFLDARGLAFTSSAPGWIAYARKVADLSERHVGRPATIIEIGAGSGEVAYFSYGIRPWARLVVVDLPPMLANLYRNMRSRLPEATFALNAWPAEAGRPDIVMLDPEHAHLIPDAGGDIAVNFNSFMEMDEDVRDGYIALAYRALRPGGIFYNVNRRQPQMSRLDGSTFDNHPLLYPYRADDRVLEWDLDMTQMEPRSPLLRVFPRIAISRVAVVKAR